MHSVIKKQTFDDFDTYEYRVSHGNSNGWDVDEIHGYYFDAKALVFLECVQRVGKKKYIKSIQSKQDIRDHSETWAREAHEAGLYRALRLAFSLWVENKNTSNTRTSHAQLINVMHWLVKIQYETCVDEWLAIKRPFLFNYTVIKYKTDTKCMRVYPQNSLQWSKGAISKLITQSLSSWACALAMQRLRAKHNIPVESWRLQDWAFEKSLLCTFCLQHNSDHHKEVKVSETVLGFWKNCREHWATSNTKKIQQYGNASIYTVSEVQKLLF